MAKVTEKDKVKEPSKATRETEELDDISVFLDRQRRNAYEGSPMRSKSSEELMENQLVEDLCSDDFNPEASLAPIHIKGLNLIPDNVKPRYNSSTEKYVRKLLPLGLAPVTCIISYFASAGSKANNKQDWIEFNASNIFTIGLETWSIPPNRPVIVPAWVVAHLRAANRRGFGMGASTLSAKELNDAVRNSGIGVATESMFRPVENDRGLVKIRVLSAENILSPSYM